MPAELPGRRTNQKSIFQISFCGEYIRNEAALMYVCASSGMIENLHTHTNLISFFSQFSLLFCHKIVAIVIVVSLLVDLPFGKITHTNFSIFQVILWTNLLKQTNKWQAEGANNKIRNWCVSWLSAFWWRFYLVFFFFFITFLLFCLFIFFFLLCEVECFRCNVIVVVILFLLSCGCSLIVFVCVSAQCVRVCVLASIKATRTAHVAVCNGYAVCYLMNKLYKK